MKTLFTQYDISRAVKPETSLKNHPGKFRITESVIHEIVDDTEVGYTEGAKLLFGNMVVVKAEFDTGCGVFYYEAYSYLFEVHTEPYVVPWYTFDFTRQDDVETGIRSLGITARRVEAPSLIHLQNWI